MALATQPSADDVSVHKGPKRATARSKEQPAKPAKAKLEAKSPAPVAKKREAKTGTANKHRAKKIAAKKTTAKKSKGKTFNLAEQPGQVDPKAPIDSREFLLAAQPVLRLLERDLLQRANEPNIVRCLQHCYEAEIRAERTADSFAQWQLRFVTQVAVSWLLSCVFVRTLEDRGLLEKARIAGPGARDSQTLFFELAPSLTERDYLLTVFRELSLSPAAHALFDSRHTPLWKLAPSANAAKELLALFRTPNSDTPAFRFGQPSARDADSAQKTGQSIGELSLLGDIYQDLSEDVRKRYALLQTPYFVEQFILDRTLLPAIERFGLEDTNIIDPTCGSGHFLLGAFEKLFEQRLLASPAANRRTLALSALDAVYGADINPFAIAITRFRLVLAFLERAKIKRLADAPMLPINVVVADSLLYNHEYDERGQAADREDKVNHSVFDFIDDKAAKSILYRKYAAVVGNPPYITVKDAILRDRYRKMYSRSAGGKYSLAAPFCQRFFELARDSGYVGQITANSFMKREFGKKLIQDYLPTVNLNLIVNTSGAYIPGHGTPTVLLFGTNEPSTGLQVPTVLAKRGEPSTPADASKGQVWSSIEEHCDDNGFENDYISVSTIRTGKLAKHPWSLAGGGATELKALLESRASANLGTVSESIGITSFTLEDDVFLRPRSSWKRLGASDKQLRPMVIGESIRDWSIADVPAAFFPYDENYNPIDSGYSELQCLWSHRTVLANNKLFGGKTKVEGGLHWYEYGRLTASKLKTPLSITFAFVATHNHFVLDRGGKVFKQSAPIIKLPAGASEDDHLALLAYLNSSTACFWMKQVCQNKGSEENIVAIQTDTKTEFVIQRGTTGGGGGYEFSGTALKALPIPSFTPEIRQQLIQLSKRALEHAEIISRLTTEDSTDEMTVIESKVKSHREQLVLIQEQIDWLVYDAFNLIPESPQFPKGGRLALGLRPFEVNLARQHPSKQVIGTEGYELQHEVADQYSKLKSAVEVSLSLIAQSKDISLLETNAFKRRWRLKNFAEQRQQVSIEAALDQIESTSKCSQEITAILSTEDQDLRSHIHSNSVPFLAAHTYSAKGIVKHKEWQAIWQLQRQEDMGETISVPPPPKYATKDFQSVRIWQLRGKLDVPKERFISYPGCESDEDGEPVYGWAGWDHLQRAQALAALYQDRKNAESWDAGRLAPMLAGLLELIPWLKQWHNEPNEEFGGLRMGNYFADFLDGECRTLGLTQANLQDWRPEKKARRGKKKK